MKRLSFLLLAAIVTAFCTSAAVNIKPSKNKETRTVALAPFDHISIGSAINVEYVQTEDNTFQATITAPQNIMPYVSVSVSRGRLKVNMNQTLSIQGECEIKVKVKSPAIVDATVSAASSLTAKKLQLPGRKFEAEVSGASNLSIGKLLATKVDLEICGASNATVDNLNAGVFDVDCTGASGAEFKEVTANEVEIDTTGASTLKISGKTDSIEIDAHGASTVLAGGIKSRIGEVVASGASTVKARIETVLKQKTSGASSITISK